MVTNSNLFLIYDKVMTVKVEKDKKGSTYIISVKKDGFTKQVNVDLPALKVLHCLLGDVLAGRK